MTRRKGRRRGCELWLGELGIGGLWIVGFLDASGSGRIRVRLELVDWKVESGPSSTAAESSMMSVKIGDRDESLSVRYSVDCHIGISMIPRIEDLL